MLSSHTHERDESRAALLKVVENRSNTVTREARRTVDVGLSTLCTDVDAAYRDQTAIESELRRLQSLMQLNARQNEMWASTLGGLSTALKELGDFGNWCEHVNELASELWELKQVSGTSQQADQGT